MNNNMSRSFDKKYDHAEMRPVHRHQLSATAQEFVPKKVQQQQQPVPPLPQQHTQAHHHHHHHQQHHHHHQQQHPHHQQSVNGHSNSNYYYSKNNRHNKDHQQHQYQGQSQLQNRLSKLQQPETSHIPSVPAAVIAAAAAAQAAGIRQAGTQQHSQQQPPYGETEPSLGGPSQYQYQNMNEEAQETKEEMHALQLLQEVINKLINDPGMFETYQREVALVFRDFAHNTYVMCHAIEYIFVQSIVEQNFRYPGARLCRLLDNLDATKGSVFRYLLNYKLNNQFDENRAFMANEALKVRGTTLFLAELYIQLQKENERILELANSICSTIYLLLEKQTPENIKCICQTLKLCGYELELDCPTETKEILSSLQKLSFNDSTNRLIKSVIDLSGNRWGRENDPIVMPIPIAEGAVQVFNNDPVFYGPDGEILTEEESTFLSDIDTFDEFDSGEADSNELYEPEPEMDLEIQMAFKEFVWNCQTSK